MDFLVPGSKEKNVRLYGERVKLCANKDVWKAVWKRFANDLEVKETDLGVYTPYAHCSLLQMVLGCGCCGFAVPKQHLLTGKKWSTRVHEIKYQVEQDSPKTILNHSPGFCLSNHVHPTYFATVDTLQRESPIISSWHSWHSAFNFPEELKEVLDAACLDFRYEFDWICLSRHWRFQSCHQVCIYLWCDKTGNPNASFQGWDLHVIDFIQTHQKTRQGAETWDIMMERKASTKDQGLVY